MAQFAVEIADADVSRVLDAVAANYNRPEQVENPDFDDSQPESETNARLFNQAVAAAAAVQVGGQPYPVWLATQIGVYRQAAAGGGAAQVPARPAPPPAAQPAVAPAPAGPRAIPRIPSVEDWERAHQGGRHERAWDI